MLSRIPHDVITAFIFNEILLSNDLINAIIIMKLWDEKYNSIIDSVNVKLQVICEWNGITVYTLNKLRRKIVVR